MRLAKYGVTAVLAMGLAGGASAQLVGAKSIVVTNAFPTWLQVAEVLAIEDITGINVAASANGGSAVGSGNFTPASSPDKAIDGNTGGNFPNIYHSNGSGSSEFLEITFADVTDLTSLTIFGRQDSFGNRDLYNISIFDAAGAQLYTGVFDARATRSATFDFGSTPPMGVVPEPASWAMMIGGFGLVGGALRRRSKQAVALA